MKADTATPDAAGVEQPAVAAPRRRWRRVMLRWLILLTALYTVWGVGCCMFQEKLIFPGTFARHDGDSFPRPREAVQLWRDIGGGARVEAWFIPGRGRSAAAPGPLVVHAHGNAELIDDHAPAMSFYTDAGISVLLPEYRGFTRSGGTPGEAVIVDDFEWFLQEALRRPEVDAKQLIFHGRSIGGGVMAQMAKRVKPAVLILESTFTSLTAMVARYLLPAFLLKHTFRTDDVLRSLDVPILILHGRQDDIVPIEHGRRLAELSARAKLVEFDARHNDFPPDGDEYARTILEFLRAAGVIP